MSYHCDLIMPNFMRYVLLFFIWALFFHSAFSINNYKIDSLEKAIAKTPKGATQIDLLYELGNEFMTNNFDKSLAIGNQIYDLSIQYHYKEGIVKGLLLMGKNLDFKGKEIKAGTYFEEALKIAKEINDNSLKSKSYNALFYFYYDNKKFDIAKSYLTQKIELEKTFETNSSTKAQNFDLIGLLSEAEGDYPKALLNYKKAKDLAIQIKDSSAYVIYLNNVGIVYNKMQAYDSAAYYQYNALNLTTSRIDTFQKAFIAIWYAKTLFAQQNTSKALQYATLSLKLAESSASIDAKLLSYELLYQIYKQKDQPKLALDFYQKYVELNNSIIRIENSREIELMQNEYKIASQNEEIKLKDQEIKNRNLLNYLFIALFVIVLTIAFTFYNRNRIRKKLNAVLLSQKRDLYEKNQEIEAQNEEISAINMNLEETVDFRTQQLLESESLLILSQRLAKLGSWVLDLKTLQYTWSNEVYHIYGVDQDFNPTSETLTPFIQADKSEEFSNKIKETLATGESFEFEYDLKTSNGSIKNLFVFAIPEVNPVTHQINILKGFVQDITDRKQTEAKLAAQANALLQSEKQVVEFKLMALRSVMNPHFLFNSLNSIQYFVAKNIKEQALDYLSQFSKLMRMILNSSMQNTITLAQEIEMLRIYVNLESLRFNKFDTTFQIANDLDIDYIEIPSLLLQPFVENAILHGLSHLDSRKGQLFIGFEHHNNQLVCIIEDNGIGRSAALGLNENKNTLHKSIGMNVTTERLKIVSSYDFIAINVVDKTDEDGEPAGTRVEISLDIE